MAIPLGLSRLQLVPPLVSSACRLSTTVLTQMHMEQHPLMWPAAVGYVQEGSGLSLVVDKELGVPVASQMIQKLGHQGHYAGIEPTKCWVSFSSLLARMLPHARGQEDRAVEMALKLTPSPAMKMLSEPEQPKAVHAALWRMLGANIPSLACYAPS
mmetsp:Transcript_15935/g.32715  ORF Transcript_15935/g.32715 Transcript_15935/m.32715 type:complete len:156 (-) Transcript_15935:48-515(-)